MKTIVRIVLVLVLLGAAAYSAGAWYLGGQAELAVNEPYKQIESIPYVKVVNREFRRGVFSSDETVTFELFGNMAKFIEQAQKRRPAGDTAAAPGATFLPFRVTVHSHIKHGPLPDGKTIAAAIVDSEVDVDDRFKPALAKVLGERKVITAHSVYDYEGNGESVVTSPAFVFTPGADANERLSWEGVTANVHFIKGLAGVAMQGNAPKLEIVGKGAHVVVAGMKFEADSKRIFDDEPLLYAGKQKFTIAQISVDGQALAGKALLLKQLSYDVQVPVNGEFMDLLAKIGVQDILVGQDNFGPAHYDFSLKHLHGRTYAEMNRVMMKTFSDPEAMAAAGKSGDGFGPMMPQVLKLLEYNPELSLDRLSFKLPQGEVLIAARARFIDVKPEDLKQPPVLLAKLDASADIALPEGLLMLPFAMKADSVEAMQAQMQSRQQQIGTLVAQGYIERDGAMVKSKLEFRGGRLTVNGKPFDPRALQPRPAPPPQPIGHQPRRRGK